MSNVRKFFAMAIVFAMVLATMVPAFAAVAPDVKGTKYEDAAELLGALGIMVGDAETGNFRPEDTIIRSEFAKVAVAALGLSDIAAGYNHRTKFNDVVEGHWGQGYINVAADQGLVIGDPEGTFRPDDPITYAEAVTVLVRVIGHEPAALASGGYPTGYLVVAAQNQMTKNAIGSANEPAKRGIVAQLVYNALSIDLMEQVGFGSDVTYEVQKDKTLLSSKLNVEKLEGQITANKYTALTSNNSSLHEDEVRINGETYKVGATNAKELLGYHVTYYVKEIDHEDVLIAVIPNRNKNNVVTVQAENIDESTTSSVFAYWIDKDNDDDPEELDIASDAKVIYNGKAKSLAEANLKPASGKVVLLDNNSDEKYDIIFVTEYEIKIVKNVNENLNKVYFKDNTSLKLDPEDDKIDFNIIKDGKEIELGDLEEWNVLSIAKSEDEKLINIYVSDDKVVGKVTEADEDSNDPSESRYFINGKEYRLAANLDNSDIDLEDEGTFYLDIDGKIAAVDTTSTASENYAYLINAASVGGISGGYEYKLLNAKGEMVIFQTAEKVRFNNSRIDDDAVFSALTTNGSVNRQLITFELDSSGKIDRIDTAANGEDEDVFSLDVARTTLTYNKATGKLGNAQYVDEDTIVFDINGNDPDDFTVRKSSVLKDKAQYDVEIYDIKENRTISVIVLFNSNISNLDDKNIVVVDKVTTTKNSDGESVQKLYGIYEGNKNFSILTEEDGILRVEVSEGVYEPLTQGDIIQFETNANGEIDSITVLFDASRKTLVNRPSADSDMITMYGEVIAKSKSGDVITIEEADGTVRYQKVTGATVYKYDSAKKSVSVSEIGDIEISDGEDTSFVFIRVYDDTTIEVVIID